MGQVRLTRCRTGKCNNILDMQAKRANKHRARSEATQADVLRAAETVFLRKGFERAQMAEIAREAGRTTGALYAHFPGKEELFLAVLKRRMEMTRERGRRHILRELKRRPGDQLSALRSFYITLYEPKWDMLKLEFKLYLVRRPKEEKRLRRLFAELEREVDFRKAFHPGMEELSERLRDLGRALEVIVEAIIVEMNYDPKRMSLRQARKILGRAFDGLTGRLEPSGESGSMG